MSSLNASFIFTDDELAFLIDGFCRADCRDDLFGILFPEIEIHPDCGKVTLHRKELLGESGCVEPLVAFLFKQIASAESINEEEQCFSLHCPKISIKIEKYHNAENMYRLTPLQKMPEMEELTNV